MTRKAWMPALAATAAMGLAACSAGTDSDGSGSAASDSDVVRHSLDPFPSTYTARESGTTLIRGGTVLDVASLVHKDIARGLKFARIWGTEVFDGQQVGPDHLVSDGDLVELHL